MPIETVKDNVFYTLKNAKEREKEWTENTHLQRKYNCAADLLFEFKQRSKSVIICYVTKANQLNPNM